METKIFSEVARIGHDFAFGKQPVDFFTRIEDQLPVVFTLQDDVGDTPLNNAILQGHELRAIHILEILKKHCPWSLDEANTSGHTALILAPACNVSGDFIGQLLTAGCELEKYDMEGKSALTYAIEHKKIQAVNVILEYVKENNKVNFLKRYKDAEFTYLQIAAMTDDVEGTKALLDLQDKDGKYMIDVYEKSQNMETVLEIAKTRRIKEDIIELIRQRQSRERFNKETVSIRKVVTNITEKSTQKEPENKEIIESTEKRTPRIKWNIFGIIGLIMAILVLMGSNASAEYINLNQLRIEVGANYITFNRTFHQNNVIGILCKNGNFMTSGVIKGKHKEASCTMLTPDTMYTVNIYTSQTTNSSAKRMEKVQWLRKETLKIRTRQNGMIISSVEDSTTDNYVNRLITEYGSADTRSLMTNETSQRNPKVRVKKIGKGTFVIAMGYMLLGIILLLIGKVIVVFVYRKMEEKVKTNAVVLFSNRIVKDDQYDFIYSTPYSIISSQEVQSNKGAQVSSMNNSKSFGNRPGISIKVNDHKVKALVDTGATSTLVHRRYLSESQLEDLEPADCVITGVTGNELQFDGKDEL